MVCFNCNMGVINGPFDLTTARGLPPGLMQAHKLFYNSGGSFLPSGTLNCR